MNRHFSQQDRQGHLTTVLGKDVLSLTGMDGIEELSGDFEWRVEAVSDEGGLDLETLLGSHATVEIDHAQGKRAFDGIVCEAHHRGAAKNGWRYDLVLRPWLHLADLRRNMRIFHDKTVIQIVEEVLSAYSGLGNPHLDVQVTEDYPVLEYTVQYGETDADFVRRQLERFGITWGWRHGAGNHTLLITDTKFNLPPVPGGSRPYYGVDDYHGADEEHFNLWSSAQRITTGAVRLTDYNFKTPNAAQEVDLTGDAAHVNGNIESYDWPGDYLNQGQGRGVVHRRVEVERGQAPRHQAKGDVVSLGAGWLVTLAGDEVPGATGRTFICLRAEHHFRAQSYGTDNSADNDAPPYNGAYVLTPDDTEFRPERRQRGPRVQGPETAMVVGDGEIDCDEHGRILVRFHWDLDGANSMRVRVSQNWAAKGWGGMVIPRIGMEVIVEHLRGDPDKPIVTGCVYNGKNTPPYDLPANKTRSTFKTDTHQGKGFNELRFEDENDEEEIFVHAQKDRNEKVRHNHTERVDNNWVQSVGHNKASEVDNNLTEIVGGDMQLRIGPAQRNAVAPDIPPSNTAGITGLGEAFGKKGRSPRGDGSMYVTVDKDISKTVGRDANELVRSNKATEVRGDMRTVVDKTILIDAGNSLTLRCGAASIVMEANGNITMNGKKTMVTMDALIELLADKVKIN